MDEPTRLPELVASLLSADAEGQATLLRSADLTDIQRAIVALGRERGESAARALLLADRLIEDRATRKAARRELHRLQASGVLTPDVGDVGAVARSAAPARATGPEVVAEEAWATAFDSEGARRLWLVGDRALGGAWLADIALDDLRGVSELELIETTRKRFQRELNVLRRDPTWGWGSLPVAYAKGLVGEGLALAREAGKPLPTHYARFTELFGEPPAGPGRPLVYETVSVLEAKLHPEWLDVSDEIVAEPEVAGWSLTPSAELTRRAVEVARARYATLVLPGNPPEQQARSLIRDAARELVTPAVGQGLRRRLEETAYIFQQTDRPLAARRAVAAATQLTEPGQAADDNPVVRALLLAGLMRAVGTEEVAGQPVPLILVELFTAAYADDDNAPHPSTSVSVSPSGLILPR